MSDFASNENANWQKEVRGKLEDLEGSLSLSNVSWNAWELEFIESVTEKLKQDVINISPKQYEKVWDLWEKL